jgi:Major Facilitator Superfamily
MCPSCVRALLSDKTTSPHVRAAQPLLPPRVVLDRNRGGAYLTVLINGAAMFGVFLFLVYYMQTDLGYSAITSGVALLPMVTLTAVTTIVGNVALMPRVGPKPLVTAGFLINAAGMAWLTRIGADSGYASALLGPILVVGIGMGLIYGAAFATGTSGVEPRDAGIASGSVSTGQQLGGAIGTALLNTIAASATADYLASHVNGQPAPLQVHLAAIHGYTTVFWWCTGIYAAGALICGTLLRRGALPLHEGPPAAEPSRQAEATQSGELSRQAEEVGS